MMEEIKRVRTKAVFPKVIRQGKRQISQKGDAHDEWGEGQDVEGGFGVPNDNVTGE